MYEDSDIQHYGVKGMHWGQRHSTPPARTTIDANSRGKIKQVRLSKKVLETNKPSDDAANAAAFKKIAKQKSTDLLSNKELQDLITRMNLEKQYKTLQAPTGARKFAADLILTGGKQQVQKVVNDRMAVAVANMMKNAKK